ncbi:MAG: hypothetical protein ACREIW_04530 [Chthoniobacterales bacterium]
MIAGAAASACFATSEAPSQRGNFQSLEGQWSCKGYFVASGKPISSELRFERDAGTSTLIVKHDDRASGRYHALELWSPGNAQQSMRASIADAYGGMRWFESAGWDGATLTWTRRENDHDVEQFAYRLNASGSLNVDWSTRRGDGPMALGDTITCVKQAWADDGRERRRS